MMEATALIPTNAGAITVPILDLSNTKTLLGKKLTPEQAQQRLDILRIRRDALENENPPKDLAQVSPRSDRELKALAEELDKDDVRFSVRITRRDGDFYTIVFNKDPAASRIEKFQSIAKELALMETSGIKTGSERGIVQAIVNPHQEMTWYQKATLSQTSTIMQTDFLDGLKLGYIADLNLLLAARGLYQNNKIYKNVLELHESSFNLYQDQITFNQDCALNILSYTKELQLTLGKMCESLYDCGRKLEIVPQGFIDKINGYLIKEAAASVALLEKIDDDAGKFITKLDKLEKGIGGSIDLISQAQEEVAAIITQFNEIYKEKQSLAVKKRDVEEKLINYQQTRARQIGDTKTFEVKKETTGGFWFFSWGNTTTETVIERPDYGADALWNEYQGLKARASEIENEVAKLENQLTDKIKAHGGEYTDAPAFHEASRNLAFAMSSVIDLRIVVHTKREKIQTQIKVIQHSLTSNEQPITTVADVVDQFSAFRDKLLGGYALWYLTNKQWNSMQKIRVLEFGLKTELIKEITNDGSAGKDKINEELRKLTGEKDSAARMLITDKELLEKV